MLLLLLAAARKQDKKEGRTRARPPAAYNKNDGFRAAPAHRGRVTWRVMCWLHGYGCLVDEEASSLLAIWKKAAAVCCCSPPQHNDSKRACSTSPRQPKLAPLLLVLVKPLCL